MEINELYKRYFELNEAIAREQYADECGGGDCEYLDSLYYELEEVRDKIYRKAR